MSVFLNRAANLLSKSVTWARLQFLHSYQTRLFDLRYGTDTFRKVHKKDYQEHVDNLENGTFYAATWTYELRKSFTAINHKLANEMENYTFIDIGCGKGKALIEWRRFGLEKGINQRVVGFDYSASLTGIAIKNYEKMFGEVGEIFYADATEFEYGSLGDKLIVHLFNPFDDVILEKVLALIKDAKTIVIYSVPNFEPVLLRNGWNKLYDRVTGWGLFRTVIYERNVCP